MGLAELAEAGLPWTFAAGWRGTGVFAAETGSSLGLLFIAIALQGNNFSSEGKMANPDISHL